jgi:flagellin
MTSILTNVGAISAVQQMRSHDSARDKSQDEVSSGLRVKNAADNTAYWSIATTMRSDNRALAAAGDSLGMGAAAIGVAYSGMVAAIDVVEDIKAKLVSAREAGADKGKVNSDITALRAELFTIADASSFNGQNWLVRNALADDADPEIVGSFTRDARGNVSVKTLNYTMTGAMGTNHLLDDISDKGILTSAQYATQVGAVTDWVLLNGRASSTTHTEFGLSAATTDIDMDEMISVSEAMLMAMTQSAANLGSLMSRIEMQGQFVADLQDTQDRGVGRLVDADLGESSAKLKAVQTQNLLATQALSIANASPLNLMRLL